MSTKPTLLVEQLANSLQAMRNCVANGNTEWRERHKDAIERLVKEHLPSGSGFDNGTKLHFEFSSADRLVFTTSFHHMDGDTGMYSGWTEHSVVVTPSFTGRFNLRVTGTNRNGIKEYIADTFHAALSIEVANPYEVKA